MGFTNVETKFVRYTLIIDNRILIIDWFRFLTIPNLNFIDDCKKHYVQGFPKVLI